MTFPYLHPTYMHAQSLSRVQLFATPWIVARQAPLSMGLSQQEYWNGLPFPPPGDLPDSGIKSGSPALPLSHLGNPTPLHNFIDVYINIAFMQISM